MIISLYEVHRDLFFNPDYKQRRQHGTHCLCKYGCETCFHSDMMPF